MPSVLSISAFCVSHLSRAVPVRVDFAVLVCVDEALAQGVCKGVFAPMSGDFGDCADGIGGDGLHCHYYDKDKRY
jgi:hypothetical protein